MKKYKNKVLKLISFILVFFICIFTSAINVYAKVKVTNKKIILLDPGHGGSDGGARSDSGTEEKNINLDISNFLKQALEKKGYKVILTRDTDAGLYSKNAKNKKREDLSNRCKIKENSNCNMFVSIHLNMFPESRYYGAQVWYSNFAESKILAEIIQNNFKMYIDNTNKRECKAAGKQYKVLRCNDTVPSVLVECGFLSNPKDEANLKNVEYQKRIAECIAKSIEEFYNP